MRSRTFFDACLVIFVWSWTIGNSPRSISNALSWRLFRVLSDFTVLESQSISGRLKSPQIRMFLRLIPLVWVLVSLRTLLTLSRSFSTGSVPPLGGRQKLQKCNFPVAGNSMVDHLNSQSMSSSGLSTAMRFTLMAIKTPPPFLSLSFGCLSHLMKRTSSLLQALGACMIESMAANVVSVCVVAPKLSYMLITGMNSRLFCAWFFVDKRIQCEPPEVGVVLIIWYHSPVCFAKWSGVAAKSVLCNPFTLYWCLMIACDASMIRSHIHLCWPMQSLSSNSRAILWVWVCKD